VVGAQFDASSVGRDEGGQGGLLDPGSRSQPNHPALAWCPRDWPACRTGYGYRPDRWRTGRGWSWPRRWRRQPPDAARPRPSAAASRRTPGTPAVVAAPATSMLSLTPNGAVRGECARVLSIMLVIVRGSRPEWGSAPHGRSSRPSSPRPLPTSPVRETSTPAAPACTTAVSLPTFRPRVCDWSTIRSSTTSELRRPSRSTERFSSVVTAGLPSATSTWSSIRSAGAHPRRSRRRSSPRSPASTPATC